MHGVEVDILEDVAPDGRQVLTLRFRDAESGLAVAVPMPMAVATKLGDAMAGRGVLLPPTGKVNGKG